MSQEEILKTLSRRKMLRDAGIAVSGTVLLPSFLTSCRKDVQKTDKEQFPYGGLGAAAFTTTELEAAALNLNRMRDLLSALYQTALDYDIVVFLALGSTYQQPSWTNFIVNVFLDIAIAIAIVVVATNPEVAPLILPAFACLSAFLHDWGIGKGTPPGLSPLFGFFANYQDGMINMKLALDRQLGYLTDVTDNYANLRAAWNNPLVFNGGTYTLSDLTKTSFPDKVNHAVEYYKIYDPMFLYHKQSVWNLAIMKCCTLYEVWQTPVYLKKGVEFLTAYAQKEFYPNNPALFLRGYNDLDGEQRWGYNFMRLWSWNLGIGGYAFPKAAVDILFIDDTLGHVINPQGLFARDYVFKEFSIKKPDLRGKELAWNPNEDFSGHDDWNFTGGFFPQLTTK